MRIKSSSFRFVCILILGSFMTTGCLKHEFTEPPDPFEQQRLEEGYATFEFGSGENKVTILTNKDNVTLTDKGNIRIRGTIFAGRDSLIPVRIGQGDYILVKHLTGGQKTVYLNGHGDIPLSKGSFKMLKNNHSGFESFEGFGGYSEFTLPKVGITQDLEIPTADGSPTGFALGSELEDFPVNPDRYYFYFYYGDQADFVLSQSSFMVDKMALDPDDPYFYVHASALSIPVLDAVEDGGFAVSVQGMIPFDVPSSLSFGKVESFNFGNIMLQASINLESVLEVPLVIQDATTVIGFGNLTDGVNFFNDMQVPMTIGIYGSFVVDIGGIVEWQVGEAAVSLRYGGPNDFKFSYAGVFDNDMSILSAIEDLTGIKADVSAFDFIQPPQQVMKIVAYGSIGSNINDWEVGMKSQSYMEFPHIMTIDLGGVDFEINPDHLYYNCRMPIAIFGHIGLAGEINKSGSFWLKAYSHAGVSYSKWGLSIDVGYKAHFTLNVNTINDWYFKVYGKVYLDISIGQPWLEAHGITDFHDRTTDPRCKASISFSAYLNSDGKFKASVRFSFLHIGYTLHFSFSLGEEEGAYIMDLEEIPESEVPIENRLTVY